MVENHVDVSICVAGIRTDKWPKFARQIKESLGYYTSEFIFCGPHMHVGNERGEIPYKFIRSFRNPTACVQEAIIHAKGELVCWLSDDAEILEDSLKLAVCAYLQSRQDKVEVIIPYFEGDNVSDGSYDTQPPEYWNAWYHGSLRLPGIPRDYKIAPCGLLSRQYFLELGGFDCAFEHINMSCNDLSLRIQNDGGQLIMPEKYVMRCEFSHEIVNGKCDCVLCEAYVQNDLPYFLSIYSNPSAVNRVKVDLDNYLNTPERWRRFTR
jgi:hypothetical protein